MHIIEFVCNVVQREMWVTCVQLGLEIDAEEEEMQRKEKNEELKERGF